MTPNLHITRPGHHGSPTKPRTKFTDPHSEDVPRGDDGSRVVFLYEPVTPAVASRVVVELLQHDSVSGEIPVHIYIFSPGGCVASGLAIIDTMRHISAPVFTYAMGYAASMGAVILASGTKGHRYLLPHSRVMIHQASGSVSGNMETILATLGYQTALEAETDELLAKASGKSIEEIRSASRVDNWMKAPDAVAFGLADVILDPHTSKL